MVDFSKPMDNYFKLDRENQNPTDKDLNQVKEDLSDLIYLFNFDENGNYRDLGELRETIFSFDKDADVDIDYFGKEVLAKNLTEGYDPDDINTLLDMFLPSLDKCANSSAFNLPSLSWSSISSKVLISSGS